MAAKSKKKEPVEDRADRDLEKVREVLAESNERWRTHNRTEISTVVEGVEGSVSLRTVGGRCYVKCDGEVVLDEQGVIDARRFFDAAFQAV